MALRGLLTATTLLMLCLTALALPPGTDRNWKWASGNILRSLREVNQTKARLAKPSTLPFTIARLAARAKTSGSGVQSPTPCCLPNQYQMVTVGSSVVTDGKATSFSIITYFDGLSSKRAHASWYNSGDGIEHYSYSIIMKNNTDAVQYLIDPMEQKCTTLALTQQAAHAVFDQCALFPRNSTLAASAYIGGGHETAPVQTWIYRTDDVFLSKTVTPEVCAPVTSYSAAPYGDSTIYMGMFGFNFQLFIDHPDDVFKVPSYCSQATSSPNTMPYDSLAFLGQLW